MSSKLLRVEIRVLNNDDDEDETEGFEEYFVNMALPDDWSDETIKDEIEEIRRGIIRVVGAS